MYVTRDISGLFLWTDDKPELRNNEYGEPEWFNPCNFGSDPIRLPDGALLKDEVPMDSIRELVPIVITE